MPHDRSLRLVYGDWLEHHGHEALAGFVCGPEDPAIVDITDVVWRAIYVEALATLDPDDA